MSKVIEQKKIVCTGKKKQKQTDLLSPSTPVTVFLIAEKLLSL